jgi:hypothetical protein
MALTTNQKTAFNADFGNIRSRRPGDGPRAAGAILSGDQECVAFANAMIAAGSYAGASLAAADVASWIASGASGPTTAFTDPAILATCVAGSMPATIPGPTQTDLKRFAYRGGDAPPDSLWRGW